MLRVSALTGFGGGGKKISILASSLGNVNSSGGTTATFSSLSVGTGGDRTLIVLASVTDTGETNADIDSCTVDGNAMTRRVNIEKSAGSDNQMAAIFTKKLTTETGSVDVVVGVSLESNTWGMSFVVVNGMLSDVPTDSATGDGTGSSVSTGTTLDGLAGGIAVGVVGGADENRTHTWASLLTERSDVQTGGDAEDHRHSVGYDLLTAARAATTETVTFSGSSGRDCIAVASFR